MTDLNVKKEYLNLIYADCGKVSAGEKVKKRLAVPGTQYLIFGVILGVFPLLAQLGVLTSSFVFAVGNTMIYAIMAIGLGYVGLPLAVAFACSWATPVWLPWVRQVL